MNSAGQNSKWDVVAEGVRRSAPVPIADGCIYAERFQHGCCETWQVKCHHPDQLGMVYPARHCRADCPLAMRLEDVHVVAVITAWNEGEDVAKTVQSLAASVERARLTICVVDDGSTDGSCSPGVLGDNVIVIRREMPQGVGRSRNAGYEYARSVGADVVTFHDAHMEFPAGTIEGLAVEALREGAITSAASHGIPSKGALRGCWMHYNPRYGLQPKWSTGGQVREALGVRDLPEWWRTPCMMGACYALPMRVADRLAMPTDRLWEDTAGRWGFSEQALAVKAFLMDVPILQSRDLRAGHKYRSKNPVPQATLEVWRNVTRSTAVLLGREIFGQRFRPYCEAHLPAAEVNQIAEAAFNDAFEWGAEWQRAPRDVFTHLLGAGAPITEPHPDHAWLPDVEQAADQLTGLAPPIRVLQWRPGESTLRVRDVLPDAEITCVEMPGHRARVWAPILEREDISLIQAPLGDGYVRAAEGRGQFDLVLVGGEMQEECLEAAGRNVRPEAILLPHASADHFQIEDGELKKERKSLSDFQERRGRARAASGKEPIVTVCLLNWARPENLGPLLDSIAAQSVPARVALWNNGDPVFFGPNDTPISEHPLIARHARATRNAGCFPRWWMASMADTEFVCSMDDDLVFADEHVLADAIAACREECPDGIVGFFGWSRVEGKSYKNGHHHNGTTTGTDADIIKGRFMLLRRELLTRVPLVHPALADLEPVDGIPGALAEDDIVLSLSIADGQPGFHRIPARLGHRWRELPQRGVSASARPGHYQRRDEIVRRLLNFYEGGK